MLSRVANSVFWMNRYIERAENVARFIEVNMHLTLGVDDGFSNQWEPLVVTTGDYDTFIKRYGAPTQKNVIDFLTFDLENPNSIISCLRNARENARGVREVISSAMWIELNKFYLTVRGAAGGGWSVSRAHDFFDQVITSSHLFAGITNATMSHGEAWHFARMGQLLERADKTSRILDVKYFILLPTVNDVGTPLDTIQWAALLKSASALEMYRKSRGRLSPAAVADFLILDRHFPRSIRFCLLGAEDSLHRISGSDPGTFCNRAEQRMGRLRAEFDYTQISDIIAQGMHEYLDQFQTKLNLVGDAISETFFAPPPVETQSTQKQEQYQ